MKPRNQLTLNFTRIRFEDLKSVCLISNKSQNFFKLQFLNNKDKYSIDEIESNYYQNVYVTYIFAL